MRRVVDRRLHILATLLALVLVVAPLARGQGGRPLTRADTLRGSNTPERAWWDVTFYDLNVRVNPADSSIRGSNAITYRVVGASRDLQIDLQLPLEVDSIVQDGRSLAVRREGNALFATPVAAQRAGEIKTVTVHYRGKPRVAVRPPWDGGLIWTRDDAGNSWVSTANQGLGASVWWPNKDLQSEEPDSQRVALTLPDPMVDVSNGRLRNTIKNRDGTTTYVWFAASPINNYAISINAGTYAHYTETFAGEKGALTMDYWPLAANLTRAQTQFTQARTTMACFEHWFGPFPWYEDGYKLIEVPYLGMEHQSAVTYGNGYQNGYRGTDLSRTGEGLKWDFIIVHESAHEWWGNNVTAADIADNWIHEGFANYSEGLYTECQAGKEAGAKYIVGSRRNITNRGTIIGTYGVQREGSGDMYYKGGSMLHTIRQIINDDAKWRGILRGIQSNWARKMVTTQEVERFISVQSGVDLSKVFDQYLRTVNIPRLEYRVSGNTLSYRWANVVAGFNMPVRISAPGGVMTLIRPTTEWQTTAAPGESIVADENFYVTALRVDG